MKKKQVAEVKKVTDISKAYILNFMMTATRDEVDEIMEMLKKCEEETEAAIREGNSNLPEQDKIGKAKREYFGAFRVEFARRFRPDLFAQPKPKERIDDYRLVYDRRIAELEAAGA